MQSTIVWNGKMSFTASVGGHQFIMDAKSTAGGEEKGPTPKELLLSAIIGCSGMDVVSLMQKMRVGFTTFEMTASAESVETYPKVYKEILVQYIVNGDGLDEKKIKKAVDMSLTKYCSVSAMVSKVSPIRYEIILNGKKNTEGHADFWSQSTSIAES